MFHCTRGTRARRRSRRIGTNDTPCRPPLQSGMRRRPRHTRDDRSRIRWPDSCCPRTPSRSRRPSDTTRRFRRRTSHPARTNTCTSPLSSSRLHAAIPGRAHIADHTSRRLRRRRTRSRTGGSRPRTRTRGTPCCRPRLSRIDWGCRIRRDTSPSRGHTTETRHTGRRDSSPRHPIPLHPFRRALPGPRRRCASARRDTRRAREQQRDQRSE